VTANLVETALYSKLTGTSAITTLLSSNTAVFNQQATQAAALPFVVFQQMSETDMNESPHRSKALLYLVKGIASTGFKQAGDIDNAIDTALHRTTLTVSGWTNYLVRRESSVRYVEPLPGGGNVYHAGGIYRLRIAK
jgi:hypothetical protein